MGDNNNLEYLDSYFAAYRVTPGKTNKPKEPNKGDKVSWGESIGLVVNGWEVVDAYYHKKMGPGRRARCVVLECTTCTKKKKLSWAKLIVRKVSKCRCMGAGLGPDLDEARIVQYFLDKGWDPWYEYRGDGQ